MESHSDGTHTNGYSLLYLDDEEEEEENASAEFSDSDEPEGKKSDTVTKKSAPKSGKRGPGWDFAKLPILDTNGLSYLPTMHYFDFDEECPVKPVNKLEPDRALTVIIKLPDESFKCLAIPLDAVYEDENE